MTLGATSVHPSVEQIILAEIEPKVIGVARTFEAYNHRVLDNPRLKIVFNDGRNFLMTTKEKFDVITADPIHPWFRGAGYLYTTEYFKLASEHLRPGGLVCQWLPLYELTPENVRSVVKTFQEHFPYTMLWLTQDDAEIVGSNAPIVIDEAALSRRIAEPAIAGDLKRVMMGSAADFLSYFVMGTEGMKRFGRSAVVNTDDNLYLEFSAPYSIGKFGVMRDNITAIIQNRENILPYLAPVQGAAARTEQVNRWTSNKVAAEIAGPALALFKGGQHETPEFTKIITELDAKYPWFAPGRFLKNEYLETMSRVPKLLGQIRFILLNVRGEKLTVDISAVIARESKERAAVLFVDNAVRKIYGQRYFSGADQDARIQRYVNDVAAALQAAYREEVERTRGQGIAFPAAGPTLQRIQDIITSKVEANS
jgi:spermidine synthase